RPCRPRRSRAARRPRPPPRARPRRPRATPRAAAGARLPRRRPRPARAGDADALMAESVDELKRDFPELYRAINVERNDRWVPALEARLREDGSDDTLVVVGAMHLLGEDGVVEKLRARGYTVERICSACAAP